MKGIDCARTAAAVLLFLGAATVQAAALTTGKDEQSLLPYWQLQDRGMLLRLVQRLPDQVRGFYLARKFTPEQAERIALSCGFQTVFKNVSHESTPSPLSYDLRDWAVIHRGNTRRMKIREDWVQEWATAGVNKVSRLEFAWSLLPTAITYEAGDYNWGLSYFNLEPAEIFDLKITWHQHGKPHAYVIKDIQCSPDIHPDPSEFGKPGL